jgi:hypothetical protein
VRRPSASIASLMALVALATGKDGSWISAPRQRGVTRRLGLGGPWGIESFLDKMPISNALPCMDSKFLESQSFGYIPSA